MNWLRDCWENHRLKFWHWALELYIALWATIIGLMEVLK